MADKDKHAFVTGGGSGIGLAIAKALSGGGWRVTIAGRGQKKLDSAAAKIAHVRARALDVTDVDAVKAAVKSAQEESGPIGLLVNNAGGVTSASFEKTTVEDWHQSLELNLMGAVHCTKAVLPAMKSAGWGRIVNVASTAGLVGYRYVSAYVAAKHGLVGLTKALALEVAKSGVTVNAICPGYTNTQVIATAVDTIASTTSRTAAEALATFAATNPMGRLVEPEEVAAAVVWLASEEAAAVNGVALPIAGGEVT